MNSDVVVLAWPEQADEARRLGALRTPRLLLVPPGVEPPRDPDDLLEWVCIPASEHEVAARVVALIRRAEHDAGSGRRAAVVDRPVVDRHGRCVYRHRWAALSPSEARLATVLCERYMEVVPDAELVDRWRPDEGAVDARKPVALRVQLTRLRQRVADLGLEVVSVRSQGVILQPCPAA